MSTPKIVTQVATVSTATADKRQVVLAVKLPERLLLRIGPHTPHGEIGITTLQYIVQMAR